MSSSSGTSVEGNQETESTRLMLDMIETRDHVTQRGLANELGIALGLTNIYLKRCISRGLVNVRKAPARRYAYYLTAKGFTEKARLTAKFLTRSLSYFRLMREDYAVLFNFCETRGLRRVILVGAGDLCEIATLAALDTNIELAAVFDKETNNQRLAGVPVIRSLPDLGQDEAVVITDMKDPQAAYEQMVARLGSEKVFYPSLLRLSGRHPARVASAAQ